MKKIIIEVGSTVTKIDEYDGDTVKRIEDVTIFFKKHYDEQGNLLCSDIEALSSKVNEMKNKTDDIYVCGTSVFRKLTDSQKSEFLLNFKSKTGVEFNIISQEEENELTVLGSTRFVNQKVCVFVAGGGSTEISVFDKKILDTASSDIGVIDIMKQFPDLANDTATTKIEEVMEFIKPKLNLPTERADVMILAGGAHEKFARGSGIRFEDNVLYDDPNASIMMDIETRRAESQRYYKEISLDEIRSKSSDPKWWFATRAMCAIVLVIAEKIGAKYIVPTDIAMSYGIISKFGN